MYHVWHWWRWGFGQWHNAHSGTKEKCMQWAQSHPGEWVVAQDKPTRNDGILPEDSIFIVNRR